MYASQYLRVEKRYICVAQELWSEYHKDRLELALGCNMKVNPLRNQHFLILLVGSCVLAGCASVQNADFQTFSTGVAAAKSQTDAAFQAITDLSSEAIIDYAASRPTLAETNVQPVLDPESIAIWDEVFLGLEKYAKSLAVLTSPDVTKNSSDAAVSLATQINQVAGNLEGQKVIAAANPSAPSLSALFTELGNLLLAAKAERDARSIMSNSDMSIQVIFTDMARAIGSSTDEGLRSTVRSHWVQSKANQQLAFLEAKTSGDRHSVAAHYVSLINGQTAQDLALASLRRSLLALADAHQALASGRNGDLTAALAKVELEAQNTLNLASRFKAIPVAAKTK